MGKGSLYCGSLFLGTDMWIPALQTAPLRWLRVSYACDIVPVFRIP